MIEQKQAIKDMIDFIAEFELWLEKESKESNQTAKKHRSSNWEWGYANGVGCVLENYRRCKQRIQYDTQPQAPELTWDDKVMILNIYHCPLEVAHPLLKHDGAKKRLDKLEELGYVWMNRAGTDYVISSKGGSLVMEWKQEIASHDE